MVVLSGLYCESFRAMQPPLPITKGYLRNPQYQQDLKRLYILNELLLLSSTNEQLYNSLCQNKYTVGVRVNKNRDVVPDPKDADMHVLASIVNPSMIEAGVGLNDALIRRGPEVLFGGLVELNTFMALQLFDIVIMPHKNDIDTDFLFMNVCRTGNLDAVHYLVSCNIPYPNPKTLKRTIIKNALNEDWLVNCNLLFNALIGGFNMFAYLYLKVPGILNPNSDTVSIEADMNIKMYSMEAICWNKNEKIFDFMLREWGSEGVTEFRTPAGETLLMLAVKHGFIPGLQLLENVIDQRSMSAFVKAKDHDNKNILHYICQSNEEVIQCFFYNSLPKMQSLLQSESKSGIFQLIKTSDISNRCTPWHYLFCNTQVPAYSNPITAFVLNNEAFRMQKDINELHKCILLNDEQGLTNLLQWNQDPPVMEFTKYGDSPISIAIDLNLPEMVRILLSSGKVDVNVPAYKNRQWSLPISIALDRGYVRIVELLLLATKINYDIAKSIFFTAVRGHAPNNLELWDLLFAIPGVDVNSYSLSNLYFLEQVVGLCDSKTVSHIFGKVSVEPKVVRRCIRTIVDLVEIRQHNTYIYWQYLSNKLKDELKNKLRNNAEELEKKIDTIRKTGKLPERRKTEKIVGKSGLNPRYQDKVLKYLYE